MFLIASVGFLNNWSYRRKALEFLDFARFSGLVRIKCLYYRPTLRAAEQPKVIINTHIGK
jgi:hypothetical protein